MTVYSSEKETVGLEEFGDTSTSSLTSCSFNSLYPSISSNIYLIWEVLVGCSICLTSRNVLYLSSRVLLSSYFGWANPTLTLKPAKSILFCSRIGVKNSSMYGYSSGHYLDSHLMLLSLSSLLKRSLRWIRMLMRQPLYPRPNLPSYLLNKSWIFG